MSRLKLYLFLLSLTCVLQPARAWNWITNSPMFVPRSLHTAIRLLDGTVLVCGGETNWSLPFTTPTASAECYLPSSNKWVLTASMAHPRSDHTATLLPDGKVMVCGGAGEIEDPAPTTLLASAEIYFSDQKRQTAFWKSVGTMHEARDNHTATLLLDGKVLVAGGRGNVAYPWMLASAEIFDPSTGTWTATASMNHPRRGHSATLLPDGRVLVAGGFSSANDPNVTTATAEIYNPSNETWTPTGSLNIDRANHWATLMLDGRVLLVSGYRYSWNGGGYLRGTETYDPSMGIWQTNANRSAYVIGSGICFLPTGDVLAAGGYGTFGFNYPTNSEMYLPTAGVWINTTPCITPRQDGTMTMLADGQILFAGGRWGQDVQVSSELFTSSTPVYSPKLTLLAMSNAGVEITFTNRPGALFQVVFSSDLKLPLANWAVAGGAIEILPGQFRFTEPLQSSRRFYRVRSIP